MNNTRSIKTLFTALALTASVFSSSAYAVDGMSVTYGSADDVDMGRVGMQWDWDQSWFNEGNWELTGYWELDFGYWDGNASNATASAQSSLADIGITPVFRFQQKAGAGAQPYVEIGIGAHLLTESKINDKDMSTNFQFGDHIGAGLMFGDKKEWDLSYRFQHYSNAGIDSPNPGIDFHQIKVGYRFD